MEIKEVVSQLWGAGIVAVIGGISFFLKRAINKTDVFVEELEVIKANYVSKEVVDKVENNLTKDIEKLEGKFSNALENLEEKTKSEISKMESSINDNLKTISDDVKQLQGKSISKEDFHRQMNKYEDKLDKIMDYIVEGRR